LPEHVGSVSVLVDPYDDFLSQVQSIFAPDFVQLHGSETPMRVQAIKKKFPKIKIIKAFRIKEAKDLEHVKNFEDVADLFLLDGAKPGSGKSFKWEMLKNFSTKKNWFLSGGLNTNYLDEALKISGAKMIDISSGIEKYPGQKSPELIQELMTKVGNVC
jgi:phosphoribosylanthranilate isomerase